MFLVNEELLYDKSQTTEEETRMTGVNIQRELLLLVGKSLIESITAKTIQTISFTNVQILYYTNKSIQ